MSRDPEPPRRPRQEPQAPPPGRRNFLGRGNDAFTCLVCGAEVLPLQNGSFRSHCPLCLWSRHVDEVPGDRASTCGGLMEPVALEGSDPRGWDLVHVCVDCGFRRRNRTALDDPRQPDSWDRLVELAAAAGGRAASPDPSRPRAARRGKKGRDRP